jgi:hypothetical protein
MKNEMDDLVERELNKMNKLYRGDFVKVEKFGNGYIATVFGADLKPRAKWHVVAGRPLTLQPLDFE